MSQSKFRVVYNLSIIIGILMIVESAGGLLIQGLYRDNTWAKSAWYGNDLVTLVVAVPVLVFALILSMHGSQRAQLVWLAMLFYTFYSYAFYLFGAAINWFFLVYVALFTLSIFALIFVLTSVDVNTISQKFHPRIPARWISCFMLLFALLLCFIWISEWVRFVLTGRIPQLGGMEEGYRLVAALDLSIQVPSLTLAAIWLWKRQPWGYVLGTMMMIADTVYILVLIVIAPFAANAGVPGAWDQVPLWVVLGAGCLISSGLLLWNMESVDSEGMKHE